MSREFFHWGFPQAFLLLVLLAFWLWPHFKRSQRRRPSLDFTALDSLKGLPGVTPRWEKMRPWSWLLLASLFAIVALARPQWGLETQTQTTQGIDIMLCLDVSTSMEAMDLAPNRMVAALEVSKAFVEARPSDRMGLVCFGGHALTQCPLTSDHSTLLNYLGQVRTGQAGLDGTAIGTGLATCVNRLKRANGKSKVIILLTDGRNNAGEIEPLAAAELAKKLGVRVYAIGAATRGQAPVKIRDPLGMNRQVMMQVDLDEDSLKAIATRTGGEFFRATDAQGLREIFREIDRLEKNDAPVQKQVEYQEMFDWPLVAAMLCLLVFLWNEHGPGRERP